MGISIYASDIHRKPGAILACRCQADPTAVFSSSKERLTDGVALSRLGQDTSSNCPWRTNAASVRLPKLAANQTATSGAKHLGHNYLACIPFLPPSTYTFASPKPKARPWRTWRASLPTAG